MSMGGKLTRLPEGAPECKLLQYSARAVAGERSRDTIRVRAMSRQAIVFGASGQLGVELVRELERRRYSVAGWERAEVDITDSAAVEGALAKSDPGVVFNAAAYNQVDVAEKEPQAALQVNALAV